MSKYLGKIIQSEVTSFYLVLCNDQACKMVKKPDKDEDVKTKAQALFLARESASHIENVLTNNKHLVDKAFKFASVKSSSSGDEESSGQDHEQEEEDEDDIEEDG